MTELVLYIGAAVTVFLALLLHPAGKSRPLAALLMALAWPFGGVLLAVYHIYLLLEEDEDLPIEPPPTPPWGKR